MKFCLFIITAFISFSTFAEAQPNSPLSQLEKSFDGKIGLYAIDTNTNQIIDYRGNERFPVQSTFKFIGAAALLKASAQHKISLNETMHYTKAEFSNWQPITRLHVNTGMTLEGLSEAAVSYSDTPAMNVITKRMGGPLVIANFAHAIGNASFNINHYEGYLNSNPADASDTSTPKDMALSIKKILLGHVLPENLRIKLLTWMQNNTTSYRRMRAGTPTGFTVADKTGSGDYGVANDIGMLWSPTCKPIVLSIYTAQNKPDAPRREDIIASATKIALDELALHDACINAMSS